MKIIFPLHLHSLHSCSDNESRLYLDEQKHVHIKTPSNKNIIHQIRSDILLVLKKM